MSLGSATWNILIAGCGAGHEAVAIQRQLQANVEAVDVEDFVSAELKTGSGGLLSGCQRLRAAIPGRGLRRHFLPSCH